MSVGPGIMERVRRPPVLLLLVAVLVAVGLLMAAVTGVFRGSSPLAAPSGCTARAGTATYSLDLAQTANASTIAAVGKRRGMPDHAVTVALAAALQESKLYNLPNGDRDSVGLFQQRPSQGWGSPRQLHNPRYAAAEFYAKLATIDGWATMPVATAAQEVQRSAAGDAYAQWEAPARVLAQALTGEIPAGLTCRYGDRDARASSVPAARRALLAELGPDPVGAVPARRGWTAASWLVAHASRYGLTRVSFHGRTWTRDTAAWRTDSSAGPVVRVSSGPAPAHVAAAAR